MPRTFIIMLDSFGVGATKDAHLYGDENADTFRHIAERCAAGQCDQTGVREGPLDIPNLLRLGLGKVAEISQGKAIACLPIVERFEAIVGSANELSHGKDTQSGHWEMACLPVLFDWGYFKENINCFPESLLNDFITLSKIPGILGNKHASGTEIIKELGDIHVRTGKPIVYTSADSVFQIAAHEETFGLERLYEICEIARRLVDPYNIGRVIARPFIGKDGVYTRTGHRRDYATPPHGPTLLERLVQSQGEVIAIGKVGDIYAYQGISKTVKATGNDALFATFLEEVKKAPDQSIVFVNLVDFDMLYGHRRDVIGYAKALEDFDRDLPKLESVLQPDDMAVITADHGCDPTCPGSDHTREQVPILMFGPGIQPKTIGQRQTFADIGQTIAEHMSVQGLKFGESFLTTAKA